jgi:hypothetical protein
MVDLVMVEEVVLILMLGRKQQELETEREVMAELEQEPLVDLVVGFVVVLVELERLRVAVVAAAVVVVMVERRPFLAEVQEGDGERVVVEAV